MFKTKQSSNSFLRAAGIFGMVTLLFAGCSSEPRDASYFDRDTGRHAAGWSGAEVHGVKTKTQSGAFDACRECHGADYSGGISSVSCFGCHGVKAPHAWSSWKGGAQAHAATNPDNAPACALCHSGQSRNPAPQGASPGCFNNTLCHATPEHAAGWSAADQHGAQAKSEPAGFASCQACHGADFSGGTAAPACSSCHGVSAPHPAAPWRSDERTHTTTDEGNASVCALCHTNGANSSLIPSPAAPTGTEPGCFNSTLCHATAGHAAGWSAADQHGVTAEQDFSACAACHGTTYEGGSASTSCYQCHNGPGQNHPAPGWIVADHKTAALADTSACTSCHGADYLGGGAHRACNSCHMENQTNVHLTSWYPDVYLNHRSYAKANGTAACSNANCHGTDLAGVALSGPSCSTCHSWPFADAACGSCHGIPPTGSVFPDIAGRHAAHAAISSNVDCSTCHLGAGSGTALHQSNGADVIFDPAYNAKSGSAAFNATAGTCSKVSCHGGKTTPAWSTGTLDVNTQCTSCHASGTAEYNSYNSGRHSLSNHVSRGCTACHDTAKLSGNHFPALATTAMEGPASATILNSVNYNGTSCSPSCHSSKTWW